MSELNTKSESKNQNTNIFENRVNNRFMVNGSALLGNRLEHSNFFEKITDASKDFTVIKIHFERATLREASGFRDFIDKTIAEEGKSIVVDLNECEFVDSSFFGVLVAGVKRLKAMEKKFYLVYDATNRLPIFSATGLDRVFTVFPKLEQALAA